MSNEEKRKVTVRRRRRTESSGERKRAEAPTRDRERPSSPRPPSGIPPAGPPPSNRPPMSMGGVPGGRGTMGIGVLILIALCVGAYLLLGGGLNLGGGAGEDVPFPEPLEEPPGAVAEVAPPTSAPFTPPAVSSEGDSWLVMLYQDADDKILERDITLDFNEAEMIGSSDRVQVVAQIDRFRGGYQGDGDWTSTKRFYITRDSDLNRTMSQEIMDLGEVNMASGDSLVNFVTWAMDTFPADKHVLILSDHGMGWPGGWTDPAPGGRGDDNVAFAEVTGDQLFLMELDEALGEIRSRTGLDKFELIGFDACLMGHAEVYAAMAPHARYAVASQESEPAVGWAYASFLEALARNPDIHGGELGRLIVESYIDEDERIKDDRARAEMLGGGRGGFFGLPSAAQVAAQMSSGITLSAVDLTAMPDLINSLNDLSYALQNVDPRQVAQARNYAQNYTSIFGQEVPPSYIDLGNFVQLLTQAAGGAGVNQAAQEVMSALDRVVIAEKHGRNKSGSNGMSIYFPNSQLYRSPVAGAESYATIADRFAADSLWDDYLWFHYTGQKFDAAPQAATVPQRAEDITAPGAGTITVGPVQVSDTVAAPGEPILMSADISGDNIGYVLFFTGLYDQASNSIYVADNDYLESADTREIDGVYYPEWGDGDFTIEFEWEPLMFAINDGTDSVLALFNPESYGATFEEAVYSVDGIYTYADDGESRPAKLYFQNGNLHSVFGFTGSSSAGAPREILPSPGDTFTVFERWLDLDSQGRVAEAVNEEGGTITFGDQPVIWEELDAAPGQYVVGFIVQDLDGNSFESFTEVTVE